MNYQPIGSSDGITKLQNKEVIFAASDMPLNLVDLDMDGFVQFPTLTAGVVPVVNIDGVKPGELVLDGATLARIFLGEIKAWNDPAVRKLNPSLKLPSRPIAVVAARRARIAWVATGKESAASLREGMQCRKSNQRPLPCLAVAHDYTPFEPIVWSIWSLSVCW